MLVIYVRALFNTLACLLELFFKLQVLSCDSLLQKWWLRKALSCCEAMLGGGGGGGGGDIKEAGLLKAAGAAP